MWDRPEKSPTRQTVAETANHTTVIHEVTCELVQRAFKYSPELFAFHDHQDSIDLDHPLPLSPIVVIPWYCHVLMLTRARRARFCFEATRSLEREHMPIENWTGTEVPNVSSFPASHLERPYAQESLHAISDRGRDGDGAWRSDRCLGQAVPRRGPWRGWPHRARRALHARERACGPSHDRHPRGRVGAWLADTRGRARSPVEYSSHGWANTRCRKLTTSPGRSCCGRKCPRWLSSSSAACETSQRWKRSWMKGMRRSFQCHGLLRRSLNWSINLPAARPRHRPAHPAIDAMPRIPLTCRSVASTQRKSFKGMTDGAKPKRVVEPLLVRG